MFFSRKNKPSGIVIPHYEGLPGFRQDFPCNANISGDMLVFSNNEGKTVNLPIAQIQSIEHHGTRTQFYGKVPRKCYNNVKGRRKAVLCYHIYQFLRCNRLSCFLGCV